MAQAHAQPVPE